MRATFLFSLVLLGSCNLIGDGKEINEYCERASDCENGNLADVLACEASFDYYNDLAKIYECQEQWEELRRCMIYLSSCEEIGELSVYTTFDADNNEDDCEEQREDWNNCQESNEGSPSEGPEDSGNIDDSGQGDTGGVDSGDTGNDDTGDTGSQDSGDTGNDDTGGEDSGNGAQVDNDGDGVFSDEDCDDNDPLMPTLDQDCDGVLVTEDCNDNDDSMPNFDQDCDGVSIFDDCDDNDSSKGNIQYDADCDGNVDTGLRIEITWVHSGDDMDLHLIAPGQDWSTSTTTDQDCYYANCVWSGLDWGQVGYDGDNPQMILDDISGVGPEEIIVPEPESTGAYTVVVHDFPGSVNDSVNDVTTNVYFYGVLYWTDTRGITVEDSYTPIASIDWSTQTITGL